MKVVFLDIDGVLNSERWFRGLVEKQAIAHVRTKDQFDPEALALLRRLLDATGAKLVVSSSWQHIGSDMLRELGFGADLAGMTGHGAWPRRPEIDAWLASHPSVTAYVVLDDDNVGGENFVRTTFNDGLTDAHVDRCVAILSAQPTRAPGSVSPETQSPPAVRAATKDGAALPTTDHLDQA